MALSSGQTVATDFIGPPIPPLLPTTGGGGGTPGTGTTGGNSNTGGTINSYDWYCPDINYANGDYMYPFDSTFLTTPHDQWEHANNVGFYKIEIDSCLAHALAIALEILEYKKRGVQYQFSYGWIYGNRDSFIYMDNVNGEGLGADDALNAMRDYGTCLYETLPGCWVYRKQNESIYFPKIDWASYPSPNPDEYTMVHNIYNRSNVTTERAHFRIGSWAYINPGDIMTFKNYIQQYGCGLLWCYSGQDLWNAKTNDGIVVYNSSNSVDTFSHIMCVRGWKTIADKEYWICQNSWKDGDTGGLLGHKGFFFVPFDYQRTIKLIKVTPCYATSTSYNWATPKIAGQTASILANEWNNLSDVLLAKLHSHSKITSPPIHYVKPGQLFTATLFNEINNNVGQMISTGISTKVSGSPITASDLNTLTTKLNNI
jgi:hypothetical protein